MTVKEIPKEGSDELFQEITSILEKHSIPTAKVKLLITDSANTMAALGTKLKKECPNMIHLFCTAHKLHLVSKFIKSQFPLVNEIIGLLKQLLARGDRASLFKECFNKMVPRMPIPHEIRWGTYQITVNYLYHYNKAMINFIMMLKSDDKDNETSTRLARLQGIFSNQDKVQQFKQQIEFLYDCYSELPKFIYKLEKKSVKFNDALSVWKSARKYLCVAVEKYKDCNYFEITTKVVSEFDRCENKNPGLIEIEKICENSVPFYMFSPITSSDTERFFYEFRIDFVDRSRKFRREKLDQMVSCKTALRPKRKLIFDRTNQKAKVFITYKLYY